jgi:hypothetical protein
MTTAVTIYPETQYTSPAQAGKPKLPDIKNDDFFGSFADLLDVINPLQHIPGVSNIYQAITGDTISSGAKIAGDALFGGPIGLFASIANAVVAQESGKDIGENLYAAVIGKYENTEKLA